MPRPGTSPIHPQFASSTLFGLGGFLDERSITIEEQASTRDGFGEVTGAWTAVAGLEDLPGTVGVASAGRESERGVDTLTVATHAIAFAGYHPQITTAMRAVVDGSEVHDIESVVHDSRARVTRLATRIVS